MRCKIVLINDKDSFYHAYLQSGKVTFTDKVCENITNYRCLNFKHPHSQGIITKSHTVGIQSIYVRTFTVFKILLKVTVTRKIRIILQKTAFKLSIT